MKRMTWILLLAGAGILAGCNSTVGPGAQANLQLNVTASRISGDVVKVVSVSGTVTNVGNAMAHGVTVVASLNGHVVTEPTIPSNLAPGITAQWSIKMTGDHTPQLGVFFE